MTQLTETINWGTASLTFDTTKGEQSGGVAKIKRVIASNAFIFAALTADKDLNWSDDDANDDTGTLNNSAGFTGGFLDLTGGSGNKEWVHVPTDTWPAGVGNVFTAQIDIKPNYTGSPAAEQNFLEFDNTGATNLVRLTHTAGGNLRLQTWDSGGSARITILAAWAPTAGTTYPTIRIPSKGRRTGRIHPSV